MLPEATYRQLFERVLALYHDSFKDILYSPQHLEQMTHDSLSVERSAEALGVVEAQTGVRLAGKRVLEIGAGMCMTLATARLRFGADAHGIEPGEHEYSGSLEVGRQVLRAVGLPESVLKCGVGEAIPHPDQSFDLVFSSNVLEHVADPRKVVAESIRVLKPGGMLCHIVPNYGSWWEGHYGVIWIPFLTKRLGRWYLRLLGKDPAFLETLQLINRPWLKRMLRPHRDQIEVRGWGQDLFVRRLKTLEFSEYAALGRLKSKLRVMRKLGLIGLVTLLGRLLHWETPLILTARKKAPAPATRAAA